LYELCVRIAKKCETTSGHHMDESDTNMWCNDTRTCGAIVWGYTAKYYREMWRNNIGTRGAITLWHICRKWSKIAWHVAMTCHPRWILVCRDIIVHSGWCHVVIPRHCPASTMPCRPFHVIPMTWKSFYETNSFVMD